MSFNIVIQAGGQSQRMGQNKALMPFLGQPLIERVVQRVKSAAAELILITNQPEQFAYLGLPLVADLIPGKGPLGGLFTSLTVASFPVVAVIACDMPFVNAALLETQRDLLAGGDWDVVIPHSEEGLEPLHALYSAACRETFENAIRQGERKILDVIGRLNVRQVSSEELRRVGVKESSFVNVNTPEEYGELRTVR